MHYSRGLRISLLLATTTWLAIACGGQKSATTMSSSEKNEDVGLNLAAASTVVGVASGKCLDVEGNSQTPGALIQIYTCNGGSNQSFTFSSSGDVRVYSSPLCLDTANGQYVSQSRLAVKSCTGQANQQWVYNSNKTIQHKSSGLCADVLQALTADKTAVTLYPCHGGTNQQWNGPGVSDAQAPTPPSNPAVTNIQCQSATVSWQASSDNVGVTSYDVYHDGQKIKSVGGSTLSTSITVVPGVSWGIYVNALDAAGNVSQASTTVQIKPPQCSVDNQPPTAPTNLSGSASGATVSLAWTASTDNVGISAYDIYRNAVKVGTVQGTAAVPPGTSFIDSGLADNTSYNYYVIARDAQANASAQSSTISVRTGQGCANAICGVTQITTEADLPWGLLTLPDGSVLYSRRDVQDIIRLNPTTGQKTSIGTVPNVSGTDGEGGLMGLEIAPTFNADRWLYIMHTSANDNRVVRIKVTTNNTLDLSSEQVLLTGLLRNKFHNGGRLRWGPDNKLYISTGDAQNGDNAQNKNGLNGKVLRMNPDGSVPSDNPFGNLVWSYGHRNPQGLAFDSRGRLWEQEFGDSTMDETNLIVKGGNYGWPSCEGTVGSGCGTAGFLPPKHTYPTSDGSCSGIAIVRDVLYVACERGMRLYREEISGDSLVNVQAFLVGTYGRLRTVEPKPDGNLWLTTTNDGDKDSIPNNSNNKILRVDLGTGAAQAPADNTTYVLVASYSGKALDVPGNSTAAGTRLQQWVQNGGSNQRWTFHRLSNGRFRINGLGSGLCLDRTGSGSPEPTQQATCVSGSASQEWTVTAAGGAFTIANGSSGQCLDVEQASLNDGAAVNLWPCNGQTNQQWLLQGN